MSEISARPWQLDYDNIYDANGEKILGVSEWIAYDLCHIVNCVNEHDALVAEVVKLKATISLLQYGKYGTGHYASIAADERQRAEKAEAEVEKLKESLQDEQRKQNELRVIVDRLGYERILPASYYHQMLIILDSDGKECGR